MKHLKFIRTLALLSPLALAPAARAAISYQWVEVPITPAAKANDAALNTSRSFDLKVTVSDGDDWLSGTVDAVLSSGSLYQNSFGDSQGNAPNAAFFGLAPALEFDTFVSAANGPQSGYAAATILSTNQPNGTRFDVDWGDLVSGGDGTWTVTRVTLSPDDTGAITGTVQSQQRQVGGLPNLPVIGTISGGAIVEAAVPEPGSLALLALGGGAMALRRRRA